MLVCMFKKVHSNSIHLIHAEPERRARRRKNFNLNFSSFRVVCDTRPHNWKAPCRNRLFVCLVFNGTSTHERQYVPTAWEGNWPRRWRMAKDTPCIILNTLNKYVTPFRVIRTSYETATTGHLLAWITCLYITLVSAFTTTNPDHTHHIRYKFPRCGRSFAPCPGGRIGKIE
jgi:hypothetical protein